jgi:hypothetical protein
MSIGTLLALVVSVSVGGQPSATVQDTPDIPRPGPRVEGQRIGVGASLGVSAGDADTVRTRRKAVHLSEQYEFRRKVHKLASYATLPLFAAEYAAGEQLLKGSDAAGWASGYHSFGAGAIAVLFGVNTLTGGLNWWETRGQTEGRTWRTVHSMLMLAADAGFVATGALAGDSEDGFGRSNTLTDQRKKHRNMAVASMSVASLSYIMMLKPIRRD